MPRAKERESRSSRTPRLPMCSRGSSTYLRSGQVGNANSATVGRSTEPRRCRSVPTTASASTVTVSYPVFIYGAQPRGESGDTRRRPIVGERQSRLTSKERRCATRHSNHGPPGPAGGDSRPKKDQRLPLIERPATGSPRSARVLTRHRSDFGFMAGPVGHHAGN